MQRCRCASSGCDGLKPRLSIWGGKGGEKGGVFEKPHMGLDQESAGGIGSQWMLYRLFARIMSPHRDIQHHHQVSKQHT